MFSIKIIAFAVISACLLLELIFGRLRTSWGFKTIPFSLRSASTARKDAYNETLGFEKIFAVILPDRQDRAEPLFAAANATGMEITQFRAVHDSEIPKEEYPIGWGLLGHTPETGHLGCLISHRRIWQQMVEQNISSALIMESDVDWDMRVKDSMYGLTGAVRELADWPVSNYTIKPHESAGFALNPADASVGPYGNGWDLLWLGHCGASGGENPRHYAYPDPGAADREHAWAFDEGPSSYYGELKETRLVFQLRTVTCSPAYAISNRGARTFLKYFEGANSPFDMELKGRCLHQYDLVCLGAFPQIFSVSPSASNMEGGEKNTPAQVKGGYGLQISARVNAVKGIDYKEPEKWVRQYELE